MSELIAGLVAVFLASALTLILIRGPVSAAFDDLRTNRDYWRERAEVAEAALGYRPGEEPDEIEGVKLIDPDPALDIFLSNRKDET